MIAAPTAEREESSQLKVLDSSLLQPEYGKGDHSKAQRFQKPVLNFIRKTVSKAIISLHPSAYSDVQESSNWTQEQGEHRITLFHLFHQLILTIDPLQAACLQIQRVVAPQWKHNFD